MKTCRHKRKDLTASSQVSHIPEGNNRSIHWFTGSSLTCLSVFKPYMFPIEDLEILEPQIYSTVNPDWFWKRHLDSIKPFISRPNKENPERDKYYKKLRDVETDLILQVNEVFSKENEVSEEGTSRNIKFLNKKAWEWSEKLIN
jgi:hypothetical protein